MIKEIERAEVPIKALTVYEHDTASLYKDWIWSMRIIGKTHLGEMTPEEWLRYIDAEDHFLLEGEKLWCYYLESAYGKTHQFLMLWTGEEWKFTYASHEILKELEQKMQELYERKDDTVSGVTVA